MHKENIQSIYPLSPLQQGMLFHSVYDGKSSAYVIIVQADLQGELDVDAFKQAWQQVIGRHPVLRTFFMWKNRDKPLQIVRRQVEIPWQVYNWSHLPATEQQEKIKSFLQADRTQGFNLSKAPLLRLTLIQTAANNFHFIWSFHHILLDGWSEPLVLSEVFSIYEEILNGKIKYRDQPPPYKEYIVWLNQQNLTKAEKYWRETLKGFTTPTPIHIDENEISNAHHDSTEKFDIQQLQLPKETTSALHLLAQQHQITLSTLFQGVWALLLSRYSGETDVVFGSTVSGRSIALPRIESMVGLFINTLPVRVQISPQVTLVSWLKELHHQQIQVRQFEYSSLRDVQAWSDLNRIQGQSLFDTILTINNFHLDGTLKQANTGLKISNLNFLGASHYPLSVTIDLGEDSLLTISHNCNRFRNATITRMLGHFQSVLEAIAANPDQPLSAFSFLNAEENQQLLVDFNQTRAMVPTDQTVVQLFEAQVAQTPNATALRFNGQALTYAQLNQRSNQLARYLQRHGVGPEHVVALCLDRSPEAVIAIWGTLKAGGSYVPLDVELPEQRLAFMLDETQAPVVITTQHLAARLPQSKAKIVCLDSDWLMIESASGENLGQVASPNNLAYIIYTSGSTGTPKGAMVNHSNLINYVWWAKNYYLEGQKLNFPLFSSLSFDLTVTSIYVPLISGGSIVIYGEGEMGNLVLLDVIKENQVDIIKLTPAHLSLIKEINPAQTRLRKMIVGGEDFKRSLANSISNLFSNTIEIYNEYGPTEATVGCMIHHFDPATDLESSVPIGRPINNTQVYILDEHLNPVPPGVMGEMCIGGAGVAQGYLNRSDLTAARFVEDPRQAGAKLYRTGDLARWTSNGQMQFLGRVDHQVKIKGYRIELGEIESNLLAHPHIEAAVVTVSQKNDADNDHLQTERMQLAAYFVAGHSLTATELRRFLGRRLPNYMIPAHFIPLNQMPLTTNGKIDRTALPDPAQQKIRQNTELTAPSTATEEKLGAIWAEVFRLEQVSVHDNFFDLGGDSIISIQIIARASQAGLHFSPQQLFNSETIANLAPLVETTAGVQTEQGLVTGPAPLTPIQSWFFEQNLPEPHVWNMSLLVEVTTEIQPHLLEEAFQHVLIHHDALRAQFVMAEVSKRWQQTISDTAPPVLRVVNLKDLPEAEQQLRIEETMAQLEKSHNLARGRLLSAAYFEGTAHHPNQLFITVHHLVIDSFSWNILLQDLETTYFQLSRNDAVKFPAKTISMKQWAEGLIELAQTDKLKQELTHWQSVFDSVQPDIPIDSQNGDNLEGSTGVVADSLNENNTHSLLKEVPAAYNTQINDILLTALALAFADWTGRRSLLINLEGHGREDILLNSAAPARTVGWFTSIFPVKLALPDNITEPGVNLKTIKEQLRAIPNKGIGFGPLRYLCQDETVKRRLTEVPLPQILFNYLGQFDTALPNATLFRLTQPLAGRQGANNPRTHILEINIWIIAGKLQVKWIYSKHLHREETIQHLAAQYIAKLQLLIAHCLSPEAGGATPSDFPLANLDEQKLNQLANILDALE